MKNLILIIAILFGFNTLSIGQDAIVKYFDKYVDDESFSVVYISPKMFEVIAKLDIDSEDPDVVDVLKNLKGLRILSKDFNGVKLYDEAISTINTSEYEELMQVRDGDEKINFWIKEDPSDDNIVQELLMLIGGDEFSLLSFVGKINLSKISKLSSKAGIKGMEHLEKIDKN